MDSGSILNGTSSANFSILGETPEKFGACINSTSGLDSDDPVASFKSLQYSLFITSFVEVLGGLFFLMTAWYIVSDKNKCDRVIANSAGKSTAIAGYLFDKQN